MPNYTFHSLRLVDASGPPTGAFGHIDVRSIVDEEQPVLLEQGEEENEYLAEWLEIQHVSSIDVDGLVQPVRITQLRRVHVRWLQMYGLLIGSGLMSNYYRLIKILWSGVQEPIVRRAKFQLTRVIRKIEEIMEISDVIERVSICDLPIENLTSTTLILQSVSAHDVLNLLSGTQARVTSVTLSGKSPVLQKIRVTALGSFFVQSATEDTGVVLSEVVGLAENLGLLNGGNYDR